MNNLNIANEALGVIARLALLIRSSVRYCGKDDNGEPTPQSLVLYSLGDALHNIGYLNSRIAEGEFEVAIESFDRQIGELDDFIAKTEVNSSKSVAIEARSLLENFKEILVSHNIER